MAGRDPDEIEVLSPLLEDALNFYGCEEYVPFCLRIIKLAAIREAVGYIPPHIFGKLDQADVEALVILRDEQAKKSLFDSRQHAEAAKAQASAARTQAGTTRTRPQIRRR